MTAGALWPGPGRDRPVALGAMRLSTEPLRDDDSAIDVLHAAFDAGINLLDTADAYCRDADDAGHNERLIARDPDVDRRSLDASSRPRAG